MATATKKAAAKKPATKPKAEESEKDTAAEDAALTARVLEMRDEEEKNWAEIADELEIQPGKAMFLHMAAHVSPKDRIKGTDEEISAKIVELRNGDPDNDVKGLSWGQLMARSGLSEGKVRKIYEDASGTPARGNRIGKGGRFPADGEAPAKGEKAAPAKPKAKASDANPSKKNINDMDLSELQARMDGKKITVKKGGKNVVVGVKSVKALEDGTMTFIDQKTGASRDQVVKEIVRVSR
jgi:hypothetical protein